MLAASFFAGQPVEVTGVISQPASPLAEGLFDYVITSKRAEYLPAQSRFHERLAARFSALSNPPLTDRFLNWSQRTLALGLPGMTSRCGCRG